MISRNPISFLEHLGGPAIVFLETLTIASEGEKMMVFMFYLKSVLRWCIVKCSVFRHEYNLKHHQILTDVLKVNKENPFEEMRQKYYNEPILQISELQK